jgi:hypothetical protein
MALLPSKKRQRYSLCVKNDVVVLVRTEHNTWTRGTKHGDGSKKRTNGMCITKRKTKNLCVAAAIPVHTLLELCAPNHLSQNALIDV